MAVSKASSTLRGTGSSNPSSSSGESSTNRLGELCGPARQIKQAAVLGISRPAMAPVQVSEVAPGGDRNTDVASPNWSGPGNGAVGAVAASRKQICRSTDRGHSDLAPLLWRLQSASAHGLPSLGISGQFRSPFTMLPDLSSDHRDCARKPLFK
jgi:hypothetical protein